MRLSLPVAAALLGSCLMAVPASAGPLPVSKALSVQAGGLSLMLQVQAMTGANQPGSRAGVSGGRAGNSQRMGGGGGRSSGYRGGRGGYRGHGGGDDGAGVAAGVLGGLLLGAIIANEAQRGSSVEACARRYRSYDRGSQTFVGRNGVRYSCP